ncbi:MAG: outer membrane or secreted lipoprotein [unclassified Hahellaceae]|nr:outer membrane or secreted lipoprotein [Hahellaceae bacterium]|tara:strand:- start:39379 stop:40239 length:861 start_codon:yes stop_codon:yes gene_type:complete
MQFSGLGSASELFSKVSSSAARGCTRCVRKSVVLGSLVTALAGCTGFAETKPAVEPEGREESTKTNVLEAGAAALQPDDPLEPMNVYLVGFHPMKDDPSHQMEAHHFCTQVNEDFAQCVLFDGNTRDANLNGIEYIISEHLFEQLPEPEKQYWHPHNGEILSGQLVAPNLPVQADHELMKSKMNSYGKTWHTWETARGASDKSLPLGEPMLAWSFNRQGEAKADLVKSRDKRMNIDTEARRKAREDLIPLARPQSGVDALKGQFQGPTQPIPGVVSKDDSKNTSSQ